MGRALITAALLALAGCGTVSDVVGAGNGLYTVSAHGVAGNGSAAAQQVEALKAANAFCGREGARAVATSVERVDPFFGRAPAAIVTFKCER